MQEKCISLVHITSSFHSFLVQYFAFALYCVPSSYLLTNRICSINQIGFGHGGIECANYKRKGKEIDVGRTEDGPRQLNKSHLK